MPKSIAERLEEMRDHYLGMVNKDVGIALTKFLEYEKAAKNPVASCWIKGGILQRDQFIRYANLNYPDGEINLYAAPILPKQPESKQLRDIVLLTANNLIQSGYSPKENSLHPWESLLFEAEKALAAQPVMSEQWRSFVTDTDIAALHRFAECCDDPESGGHDLEKEQVQRLEKIGALQRSGRISYITDFGDYLISVTADKRYRSEG